MDQALWAAYSHHEATPFSSGLWSQPGRGTTLSLEGKKGLKTKFTEGGGNEVLWTDRGDRRGKKHWKKTERRSKMGGGEMGWEEIQKPEKKEEDGKVRIGRSEGQGNPFLWKFTCQAGRLPAAYSRKIYLTSASRGDKRVDWQRAESHFWSCVLTSDSSSCLLSLNRATLPIQTKVTDQSTAPLSWCTTPQANRVQTHTLSHTHTHIYTGSTPPDIQYWM